MTGILVAAAVIALPALAFTFWPLVRRANGRALLAVPPDAREQLSEQKRAVLRALRELDFEHASGHVSDDDYAELRARYEAEAADVLSQLDRLGAPVAPSVDTPVAASPARGSAWRHPVALAASAVVLLVFGIAIGAGIVRYTAPDATASQPAPGSRPLATLDAPAATGGAGAIPPGMLQGMLQAARQALAAGQYGDAIAAYKAVLKRDPGNVDALTHMGLIAAIANHTVDALNVFDRALGIDPNYAPALLYRGQLLYDQGDRPGAVTSWERFLKVAPPGEDRDRVTKLIAEAKRGNNPPAR